MLVRGSNALLKLTAPVAVLALFSSTCMTQSQESGSECLPFLKQGPNQSPDEWGLELQYNARSIAFLAESCGISSYTASRHMARLF
ncbi:hypothetical protein RRG08_058802 [Elysia crispata]|uniref:Uncharacterized protein n=1 Tax=Elysia crispata TaxID=231223 RepID=A0AAE1D5W5_9GAST|nr:hypothetical protein RRG08_058802 [Elysia crispata]